MKNYLFLNRTAKAQAVSCAKVRKYATTLLILLTLGVGQMWGATKRVYFYNANSWSNVYCHNWNGGTGTSWPGTAMTRIGSTNYYYLDITDNTLCIFNNNNGQQTGDLTVTANQCYKGKDGGWTDKFSINNYTIYFDCRGLTGWTNPYFRIGHGSHNSATAMSIVAGTKYLYSCSAPQYNDYAAYTVANSAGWTNSHTIYQPSDEQPTGDYAITKLLDYQNAAIKSNLYLQAGSGSAGSHGETYYAVTPQTSLPTYTVSYSKTGSGTLTVTKYNGSTYDAFTSGNSVNPTQIMKIDATPSSGYALSSLSVSGATQIDATNTYYVTGNTTISATFVAEETHNVTVSYKYGETAIAANTTESNVGVTTTRNVTATDPIGDFAFSSWSLGNGIKNNSGSTSANPININTKSTGSYTMTATYSLIPCKLMKLSAAKNGTETDKGSMSYDATEHAYYKEITTDASPYYFRFTHNGSTKYCSDWKDSNYDSGKEISANGSKIDCDQSVGGWGDKPAMYYNGESGTTIKIWFDYQNKKTWITADKNKEYVLRGAFADNDSQADGMPGWAATDSYFIGLASGNTGTVSCTLNASEWYHLKAYNMYTKTWYGPSSDTGLSDGTLSTATAGGGGDFYFQSTIAGSYTFTLDLSSGTKLKVDYPAAYQLNYAIGDVAGNDGSISCATASGSYVVSGGTVTLTAPAAKTGYAWNGWYTNAAGTEGKITDTNRAITVTMNANKTLYACYTEDGYTVTVTAGAGGTVASASITGHKDTKETLPTATPNDGYYFTGWEVTSGSATLTSASSPNAAQINGVTAAATVQANFAPKWYLKGDFNSWGETHPFSFASATSGSVVLTTESAKLTNQKFKIWDKQTNTYYTVADKSITRAATTISSGWTTGGSDNDIKFNSDVIGSYTFNLTLSPSTPSIIGVTYPGAFTITFGKGTGGSTISASAASGGTLASGDYVLSGDDVTFSQTASAGYTFAGWYTTKDTGGSAVSGMGTSDNVLENVTANKSVYSRYTPNNYTVTFDAATNNGTCGTASKTVTFGSAYGELPVATYNSGPDAFAGWFTTASGEGTRVTAETIVATASNHTLYARFENSFTVTIQYKCGSEVLRAQTTTHASESAITAEITAPDILGYEFDHWSGSSVTFADDHSATTTINATAATTIVANYTAVPTVYFKNNLEWDDVYVTFDCYFKEVGGKQVPGNNGKPYYKMTQLGTSDIYFCPIPADVVSSWKWNIAFDNHGFGDYTTTHTGSYDPFYEDEFTGRGDFDPNLTMYIPYNGDTEVRNGGTYYKTGCWMKYNSTESGYKLYANTYVTGSGGSAVTGTPVALTADVAGSFEFKAKVKLTSASTTYGFMLHKEYSTNTNAVWYTNYGTINHSNLSSLPWDFTDSGASEDGTRCGITTEALGDYEFSVSFGTGRPMVSVEYPVSVGDYRLVYKDQATDNYWSQGAAHTSSWYHPSRVIRAKANAVDTVSFFIADGQTPTVELQKCTAISGAGVETWEKQGDNVSLAAISGTGVYNFRVGQNASNVATKDSVTVIGEYTGNYYIRTDASDGGWSNYKNNVMTYSEYSLTHGGSAGPYSHYFMRHVNSGSNLKFVIANDYSMCISDTVANDEFTNEWVTVEANVRFMWNHNFNKINRAYINGSSNAADRFLVLEGDAHLYDADGNPLRGGTQIYGLNEHEMSFVDDQNWIYETTVQADPNERIKLSANFNGYVQYFYGAVGERTDATTYQLVGGTGENKYKMRVVYDFKTNRLVCAWLPNSTITTETPIDADVMIIRYHQQDAQQITFSGEGKLTDVKTVYGAMEFNKYRLNNQNETGGHGDLGLSNYERDLFFFSFPFDVKMNDVFGFGTYGKHWIVEYYDGKTRAKNGYWKDSPTNWKFVTKAMRDTFVLKAYEGYVLALDLEELTMESPIWTYGVENVYLYFPSEATLENIQATRKTVKIDTVGYQCNINRDTPHGDRRVKDSHWHLIGTPSFANANHPTSSSWSTDTDLEQTIYYPNQNPATWTSSAPYVYLWDAATNKFGVISSSSMTFKAMQAYLVQYARDTIQWNQVNVNVPASVAARRANAKEAYEFRFELQQDGKELDHAFISLRDDDEVTKGFDFNFDLCKELYGAFTPSSQLYTIIGDDVAAAGNCLPFSEQTTVVPVGINASADGEYTFAIPEGTDGVGITLVDNETGIRTELGLLDYTVHLTAGTYDQRFTLEISPVHKTPTGLETVTDDGLDDTGARKVMVDGLLYIVKDGKVFDARGARIQ